MKAAAHANVRKLQLVEKNNADVMLQAPQGRSAMLQTTELAREILGQLLL